MILPLFIYQDGSIPFKSLNFKFINDHDQMEEILKRYDKACKPNPFFEAKDLLFKNNWIPKLCVWPLSMDQIQDALETR